MKEIGTREKQNAEIGETEVIYAEGTSKLIEKYTQYLKEGKKSAFNFIQFIANENPLKVAIIEKLPGKKDREITFQQLVEDATAFANIMKQNDLAPEITIEGEKFRMMGSFVINRNESIVLDLACMIAKCQSKFIMPEPFEEFKHFQSKKWVSSIMAETRSISWLLGIIEKGLTDPVKNLILLEKLDSSQEERAKKLGMNLLLYSELLEKGKHLKSEFSLISEDTPFSMITTSGCTGMPKCLWLKNNFIHPTVCGYSNLYFNCDDCYCVADNYGHLAVRIFTLGALSSGGKIVLYDYRNEDLSKIYTKFNPTISLLTPFMLHNLYSKLLVQIDQMPTDEKIELQSSIQRKIQFIKKNKRIVCDELDSVLFRFKKQIFGSKLERSFYAGATIRNKVLDFFRAIMICPLMGAYGQSEASNYTFFSDNFGFGNTLGKPRAGFEAKIVDCPEMGFFVNNKINGKPAPQGELYMRGITASKKYVNDTEKSKEVFKDEGWISTKDIVQFDPESQNFTLLDRCNNIKKLSCAKFIVLNSLEKLYEESAFVAQIYIHVESDKDFLIALVYPEAITVRDWALKRKLSLKIEDLYNNEELRKAILADFREIAIRNELDPFKHVVQLALLPEPFSRDNGCVNCLNKYRRNAIAELYKSTLENLYKLSDDI